MKRIIDKKMPADNERFHASGGVCPQTVLWEFGSVSPARTFVPPRLHKAATPLSVICGHLSAFWKRKKTESCGQRSENIESYKLLKKNKRLKRWQEWCKDIL
jgi:hypothetical protein